MLRFFRGLQKCKNMLNNFVPLLLSTSDFHPPRCVLGPPRWLCSHCPLLGPQDGKGYVATLPTPVFSLFFLSLLPTLGFFECGGYIVRSFLSYCLLLGFSSAGGYRVRSFLIALHALVWPPPSSKPTRGTWTCFGDILV